jgi:hypothetical protein
MFEWLPSLLALRQLGAMMIFKVLNQPDGCKALHLDQNWPSKSKLS